MKTFDWVRFVRDHNIPFVTSGPNTAQGHISIKCPYCGSSDPSQHMGLSKDTSAPVWGCLRNSGHRGRNPRRLVQRLLGVSFGAASALVEETQKVNVDALDVAIRALSPHDPLYRAQNRKRTAVSFPKTFRKFEGRVSDRYSMQFLNYVAGRGFGQDSLDVCQHYDLRYAMTGDYAYRVIFPVYFEGELFSWTGRTIGSAIPRYMTMADSGKELLYNWDNAAEQIGECRHLIFAEGPFDVVKLDYYGTPLGFTCVGGLGTALSREQIILLSSLAKGFTRCWVMLDNEFDATMQGFALAQEVEALSGVRTRNVSLRKYGMKDPGEMLSGTVLTVLRALTAKIDLAS